MNRLQSYIGRACEFVHTDIHLHTYVKEENVLGRQFGPTRSSFHWFVQAEGDIYYANTLYTAESTDLRLLEGAFFSPVGESCPCHLSSRARNTDLLEQGRLPIKIRIFRNLWRPICGISRIENSVVKRSLNEYLNRIIRILICVSCESILFSMMIERTSRHKIVK